MYPPYRWRCHSAQPDHHAAHGQQQGGRARLRHRHARRPLRPARRRRARYGRGGARLRDPHRSRGRPPARYLERRKRPGLARIADAIHEGGAAAVIQITHGGARCPRQAIGAAAVSPSGIAVPGDPEEPRAMSLEEIEAIPELLAASAGRARAAGFDGVEVHGAHGYLLNQFMSPYTNHRDDVYSGSLEHRLRLIRETLEAVRREFGPGLLMYRLGADDTPVPGITPTDAATIGPYLEDWGVDLIDCSGGLCGSRPADRTEPG